MSSCSLLVGSSLIYISVAVSLNGDSNLNSGGAGSIYLSPFNGVKSINLSFSSSEVVFINLSSSSEVESINLSTSMAVTSSNFTMSLVSAVFSLISTLRSVDF